MRLSASTRRWLARMLAPRKRAPGGKRRHAPEVERATWRSVVNPKGRCFANWIGRKQVGQAEMTRRAVKGKAKKRRGGKKESSSAETSCNDECWRSRISR